MTDPSPDSPAQAAGSDHPSHPDGAPSAPTAVAPFAGERLRNRLERMRRPLRRRLEALERQQAVNGEGQAPGQRDASGPLAASIGLDLGRAHAAVLDELSEQLFAVALTQVGGEPGGLALAGVGGFGRGAVALGADLDLRLLTTDLARAEAVAEALLYPLWDTGLAVGHQVQTVDALIDGSRDDLPTATSLLDWRHIAGDEALTSALDRRARAGVFAPSELPGFMGRLEAEVAERHRRFGGSVYLLEPDVKNGAGGLRDVDVARWAARARWGVRDLDELLRLGVVVEQELRAVLEAREHLWRIRNVLHARAGRRSDRLGFDHQEVVAQLLGYPGSTRDAAERFMSDTYRAARVIAQFRDATLARATPRLGRRRRAPLRDLGDGIALFDGQATTDLFALRDDPALALRLVEAAVRHDAPLLPRMRSALVRLSSDPEWAEALRSSSDGSRLFVRLVTSCAQTRLRAGSVMRELHDLGLLLAMVPEFAPVVGRVHHDVYHVYTVDVHSVAAVDRLGEIVRGEVIADDGQGERWEGSLAVRLAAEMTRPEVLFFATLLHDVGKAIGRADHSERGAEMARAVLARLGFEPGDVEDACRLVRHHLVMYRVATRRDLDDPATVADFVRLVGGSEALRHLYLLTVADVSTTSPTSMTSWKARMLDELYIAADGQLRGAGPAQAGRRQRQRAAVLEQVRALEAADGAAAGVRQRHAAAFVDSMPERYALANSPAAVAAHAELVRQHAAAPVSVAWVPSGRPEIAEICVVAPDRPGLLAAITAALSGSRLQVHAAQIHSRRIARAQGGPGEVQAVDLFWVRRGDRDRRQLERLVPRLRRDLAAALSGSRDLRELARVDVARGARSEPEVATKVVLDNRASPEHTVIEVFSRDRPGLLFTLADTMYRLGLTIAVAKINTEGGRVIDVFYVREQSGAKVRLDERAGELRRALMKDTAGSKEPREER